MLKTGALVATAATILYGTILVEGPTSIWAQWGLAGVVVGWMLWRDTKREERCMGELERLNRWIAERLLSTLERCATVLQERDRDRSADRSRSEREV